MTGTGHQKKKGICGGETFANLKELSAMNGSHNNHWGDYIGFLFIMVTGKQKTAETTQATCSEIHACHKVCWFEPQLKVTSGVLGAEGWGHSLRSEQSTQGSTHGIFPHREHAK